MSEGDPVLAALVQMEARLIAAIAGTRTELMERVDRLQDMIAGTRTELMERVDRLQDMIVGTRAELIATRTELMERIDRVQETMTQFQSEIIVNFGNTDRVDRRAQSAHDEIKLVMEMVSEMVRMVRRLETRVASLEEKA